MLSATVYTGMSQPSTRCSGQQWAQVMQLQPSCEVALSCCCKPCLLQAWLLRPLPVTSNVLPVECNQAAKCRINTQGLPASHKRLMVCECCRCNCSAPAAQYFKVLPATCRVHKGLPHAAMLPTAKNVLYTMYALSPAATSNPYNKVPACLCCCSPTGSSAGTT
jgi:hypothetical protein